ncbi:MAG: hypothetical protein IKP05_02785 [Alphaproteobacteria bacterium]|nr:hypothetical protein [Alphaproteobacteria bacterium]
MKKVLCCLMTFLLLGCAEFSWVKNDVYDGKPPVPKEKVAIKCTWCDYDELTKYFKYDTKADYEIVFNTKTRSGDSADTAAFITGLTLGIIPTWVKGYGTVNAELVDKVTEQSISLGTIETSHTTLLGWLFLPLTPFAFAGSSDYRLANEAAASAVVKMAALVMYDPTNPEIKGTWHCSGYKCRYKEIMAQKKTSPEDVVYVAENTKSFDEFQAAKNKLSSPLTNSQNCTATLAFIKNGIISKTTQRYWSLIDFYKSKCTPEWKGVGMTKARLIETNGIPTKGYKMNADTEIITYSSLSSNGESVVSTTYTLDRDIVTKISK